MTYLTREDWLRAAVEALRPRYADHGTLPDADHLHPIFSWPKDSKKAIGQCFPPNWTGEAGVTYVTISPVHTDPVEVLDTLVHELVHALGIPGHGKDFRKVAVALGLEGKMTATVAGEELKRDLAAVADELGPLPHVPMSPTSAGKKETTGTRHPRIKLVSPEDPNYFVEISPKRLETYGPPTCPICGQPMEPAA